MGNTRIIRDALNTATRKPSSTTYPRITSGVGGYTTPPSVVEVAGYPMSNVVDRDIYRSCVVPANSSNLGTSDYAFDVDLGANRTIVALGLRNFRLLPGSTFPTQCQFFSMPAATGYVVGSFVPVMTGILVTLRRTTVLVLDAPISARYVRCLLLNTAFAAGGFSVGALLVAQAMTDLGIIYRSANVKDVKNRRVTRSAGKTPTVTKMGRDLKVWTMNFGASDEARLALLRTVQAEDQFVTLLDYNDLAYDCMVGDELDSEHIHGAPHLHNSTLTLEEIP